MAIRDLTLRVRAWRERRDTARLGEALRDRARLRRRLEAAEAHLAYVRDCLERGVTPRSAWTWKLHYATDHGPSSSLGVIAWLILLGAQPQRC